MFSIMNYFLLCSLFLCLTNGQNFEFSFDSTLEGWKSNHGYWQWADRQLIQNILPIGQNEGFAALNQDVEPDQLYLQNIYLPDGGEVNLTFFVRSAFENTNYFRLIKVYNVSSDLPITIYDFDRFITSYNEEFITMTVVIEPDKDHYYIGFDCYNIEKPDLGQWFQGCLIDSINVVKYSKTTTPMPTTTSVLTTTEITTTQEPTTTLKPTTPRITTTPEPTTTEITTTQKPTTTLEPTTPRITTTPEPTTTEITTTQKPTTLEPTTTPEIISTPEATTTEVIVTYPPGDHGYNFRNGMDGWTLSHMNGALWARTKMNASSSTPSVPRVGRWIIEVKPAELFSATTLAQSPHFQATDKEIQVEITFWMEGLVDGFPPQLKVRKRTAIDAFDKDPIINLDNYGSQVNGDWITVSGSSPVPDRENFVLVLEGSLAGENGNKIYVSEIVVTGVEEIPLPDSTVYDFEHTGLTGFTSGNMDGANWFLLDKKDEDQLHIPKPPAGDMIICTEKFDTHAGVASIETPPITVLPGSTVTISFYYWYQGTASYPAALRLRVKTNDGRYQPRPFINLVDYGEVAHAQWLQHSDSFNVDEVLPPNSEFFQLVLEADLGAESLGNGGPADTNVVALDDLSITSRVL